jgi:hypothetical protein
MTKKMVRKFLSKNSHNDDKRINSYLDQKVINANREIDQEFYGEEHQYDEEPMDTTLYNMGDSTPIINEDDTK